MAYPANLTTLTATHRVVSASGQPLKGYVTATPAERVWAEDGSIVAYDAKVQIAPDGTYEIELPHIDQAAIRNKGVPWRISEYVPGRPRSFWVAPMVEMGTGEVDVATMLTQAPAGKDTVIQAGPVTDAAAASLFDQGGQFATRFADTVAELGMVLEPGFNTLTQPNQLVTVPDTPTSAVQLVQDGQGFRTVSWPDSVIWDGNNVPPTLQTAPGAVDEFVFSRHPTVEGYFLGRQSGQFPPPPPAAMPITFSATDTTVTLRWDPVATAVKYQVRRGGAGATPVDTTSTYRVYGGLTPQTTTVFEVRAQLTDLTWTGWGRVDVTTLPALSPVILDNFTAPDGTPLNGRLTPTGGVAWKSGDFLTGAGTAAGSITGNAFHYSGSGGSPQGSIPITSRNARISLDYALEGALGIYLFIGNSASDGITFNVYTNGAVQVQENGTPPVTIAPAGTAPATGTMTVQIEGTLATVFINGTPVHTRVVPAKTASRAAVSIYSGKGSVDNLRVVYL